LQINLNIAFRIILLIGLIFIFQPRQNVAAQSSEPVESHFSASFLKQNIHKKAGELTFNIVKITNHGDSAIRFKPFMILPQDWSLFSLSYNDTVVGPHDSISLIYRFKLPENVSSEVKYDLFFRAYSMKNELLAENLCHIYPEPVHNWEIFLPERRVFFYPRSNETIFDLKVENKGNASEVIDFQLVTDKKIEVISLGDWQTGQPISLNPFQDTTLKLKARYISEGDRVFDISKMQINAKAGSKQAIKALMIEKYSDTYAPFLIDRALPHQFEIGFRTFSRNEKLLPIFSEKPLPFVKARGIASFEEKGNLIYNFNYYAVTGNENFIRNTYYNFLYDWKTLKVGLGAFSSKLGRNMYTRNGIMVSNIVRLSPALNMEAFLSQSILSPKTSVAAGLVYEKNKLGFKGSVGYDLDQEKKVNTGSVMIQSSMIPLFRNQNLGISLYGNHEYHYLMKKYTMAGFAWDLNYFLKLGKVASIQLTNNYGSPDMPGTQMGLFSFSAQAIFFMNEKKRNISVNYINSSREYYNYSFEGDRLPESKLYDQSSKLMYHNNSNSNHIWEAGPSIESYVSFRPPAALTGVVTEFRTQKIRFEYKGNIMKNLMLVMKTGVSNIHIIESRETKDQRFDFHLLGGYNFLGGYGVAFSYDYGPMVSSGLYQFAGDAKNHSINVGPSIMKTYFKERLSFNLFSNFTYRFDLNYGSLNINPKVETYVARDWYVILSGTYHYTRQEYPEVTTKNSYVYFEFSVKKRWGKSEFNKWHKGTRRLKVELFKDDNGNGIKDDNEEGVPYVKTRVVLTNTDNPEINIPFPVDITLLSNEKGIASYNRLPAGFYELSIIPLSDVKEYFYVNRSIEKLQVTKNMTYYVPFQKATKLTGKLTVERQKFIKKGTELLDLKNIRITAYDNQGNSYSSFTLEDGTFTIFVPGNNTYYLRMGNVFGEGFRILQNDIKVDVLGTAPQEVLFNVVEINRQVKFKGAKPAATDTTKQEPLKIKVLQGKFYENSSRVPVDKEAIPEFNIKEAPVPEEAIIPGKHYVVMGSEPTRTESVKLIRILEENGLNAKLGYLDTEKMYYVFIGSFDNKGEAREELDRVKNAGLYESKIIKF